MSFFRVSKKKEVGTIRKSQTVSTFGPGAIIDLPNFSGIVSGIDFWKFNDNRIDDDIKIREHNLENKWGVDYFLQAQGDSGENADNKKMCISVFRFPETYYCPNCHQLDSYKNISKNKDSDKLFCNNCGSYLIPSRFIIACPNGHLDEFPYSWWVHRGEKGDCNSKNLTLEYSGKTGGLAGITIKCETCGATANMSGVMSSSALAGYKCHAHTPWEGDKGIDAQYDGKCSAACRTLQRGANNVYYPKIDSALTIPPWSSAAMEFLNKKGNYFKGLFWPTINMDGINTFWLDNGYKFNCGEADFIDLASKFFNNNIGNSNILDNDIIENEYRALCGPRKNEKLFQTEKQIVPSILSALLDDITIVHRLREVQVLYGFNRIKPVNDQDEKGLYDRKFSPLYDTRRKINWLPCNELFGEGIFVKFNEKEIENWENENYARYEKLNNRISETYLENNMLSEKSCRFILLHTFAHLFIREIAGRCGYMTASIKEKIYSTINDSDVSMCGVLIYTASTDTDGSLGGLSRQGETKRFEEIIISLLENASWCSNDPLCIEANSQGYSGLNLAACHACTLLPETSCVMSNCLLDRAAIVGTPENEKLGFFKNIL